MNGNYVLDKGNAKLMGVCSGFANWSGIDPLIVRLGLVVTSLFFAPVMVLLYLIIGFVAPQR
jgi:phage shock protein C